MICFIIPARLESKRFPNKVLAKYNGKPIINNMIDLAKTVASNFDNSYIIVASDSNLLEKYIDVELLVTENISCGSERAYHVFKKYPYYDFYITLPSDEPSINPDEIVKAIKNITSDSIYTLYTKFFNKKDLVSNYSCKIVLSGNDIVYTSRSVIPSSKSGKLHPLHVYNKHVGVFCFPNNILDRHKNIWTSSPLSELESLEQNMFINREFGFKAIEINHIGFGVDSKEHIKQLEKRMGGNSKIYSLH